MLQVAGVDLCYDCAAETRILSQYLAANPCCSALDPRPIHERIAQMMEDISGHVSSNRSMTSVIDVRTRKEWFEGRSFDTKTWNLGKPGDGCYYSDDSCGGGDNEADDYDDRCNDHDEDAGGDYRYPVDDCVPERSSVPPMAATSPCSLDTPPHAKRRRSASETCGER